jgi:protein-S-isoprenylcysteine O-methyltransferase Ste14
MALIEEFDKQGNFLFKYRGQLPVLLLLSGLGFYIYWIIKDPGYKPDTTYSTLFEFACLAISLSGLLVRILTVGSAAKNTSGRNTQNQLADKLNTTGAYSMLRHPLYLGNFLMYLGIAVYIQSVWFVLVFCLVFWVYYERIMFAEEHFLRRKFGDDYLNWSKTTPAFWPRFRNWTKPMLPLSLKKILRREYTGFFLTIFIFYLFEVAGSLVRFKTYKVSVAWNVLIVFALIVYITLRTLKKSGKLNTDF